MDVLKDSDYSYLYSVQYSLLKDKIAAVYEECAAARERIGTAEITGHECLADGVYRTTYATGVTVVVNYNLYPVSIDGGAEIEAQGYLIEEVEG